MISEAPPTPFSFVLVGAGKVGSTIAGLLHRAGNRPLGVASRTRGPAEETAAALGCPHLETEELPDADVCLLGVPDAAIAPVATLLAPRMSPRAVLVHFAGSMGAAEIAEAAGHSRVAALHPVQAFADARTAADRVPGSAWGVTCTSDLEGWAHRVVVRDLAGIPVPVPETDRPLWHAAAVMTSNGLAAVVAAGAELLGRLGIEDPSRVSGPLARGTLDNVLASGAGAAAITGPVVRGERATTALHSERLAERIPESHPVYLQVTRMIVEVASSAGRIDEATRRTILDSIEP